MIFKFIHSMKSTSKNRVSKSVSGKTVRMTASEFLRNLSDTFSASERRLYTRREGADLVVALRSALASPARLLPQDSITRECYRYLSIVNRTPISGLSLIACLGNDLARQIALSSRLQTLAADLTDSLRSGKVKPDDEVSEYDMGLYLDYVQLLSYSSCHFDIDMDGLVKEITSASTYHTLREYIFKQFDENPNVPEPFIEAFILAHAYLYRLSFLE